MMPPHSSQIFIWNGVMNQGKTLEFARGSGRKHPSDDMCAAEKANWIKSDGYVMGVH